MGDKRYAVDSGIRHFPSKVAGQPQIIQRASARIIEEGLETGIKRVVNLTDIPDEWQKAIRQQCATLGVEVPE
jgi:hypothetical protein